MRKAGARDYRSYSKKILKICNNKPVSFEVFADEYEEMKIQAMKINTWGKNVYVKVPVANSKGKFMGRIIKELNDQNVKLNITAVYSAKQTEKILKLINKKSIVKGFTTNPSLMRKAGAKDYKSYSKQILKVCKKKPISFEVFADDQKSMIDQGKKLMPGARMFM